MEAKATLKYVRMGPRKVRRIINLIRGKIAEDALVGMQFMKQRAAVTVSKVLKSAIANAEQKEVSEPEKMKIIKAFVDQGPTMKRIMPRAMGRANVIKKRTSHITLVLSDEIE